MAFQVGTIKKDVYDTLIRLQEEFPLAFKEIQDHLTTMPFTSIPHKYFKVQQYNVWEYRLPNYNRIYCLMHGSQEQQRVLIYGAGDHPKKGIPPPPKLENIDWSKFQTLRTHEYSKLIDSNSCQVSVKADSG